MAWQGLDRPDPAVCFVEQASDLPLRYHISEGDLSFIGLFVDLAVPR